MTDISSISGSVALILGSSSGIGADVARRFGAMGARVFVHGHSNRVGAKSVVAAIRANGGAADLVMGDVSDRATCASLIDQVEAAGGLDILINNAGAMFGRTEIADATDEQYDNVIALNVGSVFFACRRAAQHFKARGRGIIVNTTSVAARTGGGGGAGLYGSAKGFVSTITRVLAKELAPSGVRVNAVAPGVILTPFHEKFSNAQQLEASRQSIPMGRLGRSEECVGAFEFLCDERMSSYVTGQVIEVNGGQLMP